MRMAVYRRQQAHCLVAILLMCSLYVAQGNECKPSQTHFITWTSDGVRQYTPSNPLQVALSDCIVFTACQVDGYNYSNIWRQSKEEQYNQCGCNASSTNSNDYNDDCNGDISRYFECFGIARNITVQILSNSDNLEIARVFEAGTSYYFTSYSDGKKITDSNSDRGFGGECKQGLRMAVYVQDTVTETTKSPPETENPTDDFLIPDETDPDNPNVDLPDNTDAGINIPGGIGSESGSTGDNIDLSDGAPLSKGAPQFTAYYTTLFLFVCVTLVALLS